MSFITQNLFKIKNIYLFLKIKNAQDKNDVTKFLIDNYKKFLLLILNKLY